MHVQSPCLARPPSGWPEEAPLDVAFCGLWPVSIQDRRSADSNQKEQAQIDAFKIKQRRPISVARLLRSVTETPELVAFLAPIEKQR